MTVFVFDNAPEGLRGEVTRWFLEVKPGVFVGKVNRRISDLLWTRFCASSDSRGGLRIESAKTEQGYRVDMYGSPYRRIADYDGVQLIQRATVAATEEVAPEEDDMYPNDPEQN